MTSSDARTLEVELRNLLGAGAQFRDLRQRYDHARSLRDEKAEALSNRDRHCRWVDRMMERDRRRRWVVRLDRKRKGERHRRWVARRGRMMKRDRRHREAVSLGGELNLAGIELGEQICICRQAVNGLLAGPNSEQSWQKEAYRQLAPAMKDLNEAVPQIREVNPEAQGGPTHSEILDALERHEPAIRECGQYLADMAVAATTGESRAGAEIEAKVDLSAYIDAKDIIVDGEYVKDYRDLRRILKDNPWIKRYQPNSRRLKVHAGNWNTYKRQQDDALDGPVLEASAKAFQARMAKERES